VAVVVITACRKEKRVATATELSGAVIAGVTHGDQISPMEDRLMAAMNDGKTISHSTVIGRSRCFEMTVGDALRHAAREMGDRDPRLSMDRPSGRSAGVSPICCAMQKQVAYALRRLFRAGRTCRRMGAEQPGVDRAGIRCGFGRSYARDGQPGLSSQRNWRMFSISPKPLACSQLLTIAAGIFLPWSATCNLGFHICVTSYRSRIGANWSQ